MAARSATLPADPEARIAHLTAVRELEHRMTALAKRRARLDADAEKLRTETAEVIAEARPYFTRPQLAEALGISLPRVNQLLAEIGNGAPVDERPAGSAGTGAPANG